MGVNTPPYPQNTLLRSSKHQVDKPISTTDSASIVANNALFVAKNKVFAKETCFAIKSGKKF
jgi:hypothetical protein